jgi:hypothetical protein
MHRLKVLAVATLAFAVIALAGGASAQAPGANDVSLVGSGPTAAVGNTHHHRHGHHHLHANGRDHIHRHNHTHDHTTHHVR